VADFYYKDTAKIMLTKIKKEASIKARKNKAKAPHLEFDQSKTQSYRFLSQYI